MGDNPLRCFWQTVIRPLLGTLAASLIQCFFLSFTDFGIPSSVGGRVEVVAGLLYNEMLGSVPNLLNCPVLLFSTPILIPYIPGAALYYAMYDIIRRSSSFPDDIRVLLCQSGAMALGILVAGMGLMVIQAVKKRIKRTQC